MQALRTLIFALLGVTAITAAEPLRADAIEDFYRGRNMEIVVGTGPGGGYDLNARLVSRHFGRFVPGAPKVIVTNTMGAGGIIAANLLFNVSARDGSVIGTFSNALLTAPLLAGGSIKFEPRKFNWLGSVSREDGVCITSKASDVATWTDLLAKEVVIGTTAPGTTTFMYPTMLRNLFGAKFRVVSGYPDGSSIVLAFERGESQALCQTFSSLNSQHPDWIPEGKVNAIVALGLEANPRLPGVPAITALARSNDEKAMLKVILAPTAAGRPFLSPPAVPPARLAALRQAFDSMVADAGFKADAAKLRIEVEPMAGKEIHGLLDDIYEAPKGLIDSVKAMVKPQ
ncbi:MAG: tripartite tricarboxylate transporter substrate-binding protein [Beijerinckiaceae bacterium]|nr:tripartite tricarboxylate transporter substrate-binding protein [Beijerinckiaceae bacterium]